MFRVIAGILGSVRDALAPQEDVDPARLAVRLATARDLDAIVGLNSALSEEHSARFGAPIGALVKSRSQFKQAMSERHGLLLVATVDGEVVGYAHATPMAKGAKAASWLEAVFVLRKFRETPLLEWLARDTVAMLRASGAIEVMTRVRADDNQTAEVLAQIGLQDRYRMMQGPISRHKRIATA